MAGMSTTDGEDGAVPEPAHPDTVIDDTGIDGTVTENGVTEDLVTDGAARDALADEEIRDELPDDLNAVGYVGPYTFPDNSRRRIQGALYLAVAAVALLVRLVAGADAVLVNDGYLWAAAGLAAFGVYCLVAGWPTRVDETDALVVATRAAGFPVGHASAQLSWRGLLSRPTWRILLYSAEEPPAQRGLVLVDALDGSVLEHFIEANPEDWAELV
jgi:hypothetical protein